MRRTHLTAITVATFGLAALVGCGNNGAGKGTSSSSSSSTAATTSKSTTTPKTPPSPVTSAGTPQTHPAPVTSATPGSTTPPVTTTSGHSRFLYTANFYDDSVSAFSIDATGAPKFVSNVSPGAGTMPWQVVADPKGKFVFSIDSADVAPYAINQTTGALSAIGTSPVAFTGVNPASLYGGAVTPDGAFLLVCDAANDALVSLKIDPTTGSLGTPNPATLTASSGLTNVAVDPTSKFAFVVESSMGQVESVSIEAGTGNLKSVSTVLSKVTSPDAIAIDPKGAFLYVGGSVGAAGSTTTTPSIETFSISATGQLTSVGTVALGNSQGAAFRIQTTSDGKLAYVTDRYQDQIEVFSVDTATGKLTALAPTSTFTAATSSNPAGFALDKSGKIAFTSNAGADSVTGFAIGAAGAITTPAASSAKITPNTAGGSADPRWLAIVD